jgi:hypothetical protein
MIWIGEDWEERLDYAMRYVKKLIEGLAFYFIGDIDRRVPKLIGENGKIIRRDYLVDMDRFELAIRGNSKLERVYNIYQELKLLVEKKDYSRIKEKVEEIEKIFDETVESYQESQRREVIWLKRQ